MGRIEILKCQATRQFRHNTDNSPDVFKPEDGFVIAYDKGLIDAGLQELEARSNTNWNLAVKQKYRADKLEAQLEAITDGGCCGNLWKSRAQKAEQALEQVRDECLKHVKLTKSPVLVLDTIGWILGASDE